jgi:ketosteroid isomerase-like protein
VLLRTIGNNRQIGKGVAMETDPGSTRRAVEGYVEAFAPRDVEKALEFFSDDAEMTEPPGTFTGKDGVRRLLEWDVRLSPVAKSRPSGIGLLAQGNVAVEEEILEQTYEGRPYEYPLVRVFEIGDDGKIRRLRVYFDRLGIEQQVARQYPGIRGWIFRRLINFVIAQGEKGLRRA